MTYLPTGLPRPLPAGDGLDVAYWEGTAAHELRVQRCRDCRGWQWPAEWICHHCHSFGLGFEAVEPTGLLFSYERVWHPVHPALAAAVPYVAALIELPQAGSVRVIGNLLGDAHADYPLGSRVRAVFEDHHEAEPHFTLAHWTVD